MQIIKKIECCGLKFCVCDGGFLIDLRNGKSKMFTNARQAVIVFSEEICSLVAEKLFVMIVLLGYDKNTGERTVKE